MNRQEYELWKETHKAEYEKIKEKYRDWGKRKKEREKERARFSSANHRRRLKEATIEKVSLQEIFERDGGICQLCGWPVDPELKSPHPESATLDHIVPLLFGGTHEKSNLQLAHRRCNSIKGGESWGVPEYLMRFIFSPFKTIRQKRMREILELVKENKKVRRRRPDFLP